MKYLTILLALISLNIWAEVTIEEFMNVAKQTSSVYSGTVDVDYNNPASIQFETLINNQLTYLMISATHLNSSLYTVINSQTSKKSKDLPNPPVVNINDLDIAFAGTQTATCDGTGIATGDKTCVTGKNCTISQRIISSCNATDCWATNPTTDRDLVASLSEKFSLNSKIDISDCVPSNTQGFKQNLNMTVADGLYGGTINYAVVLQNDTASSVKRRR